MMDKVAAGVTVISGQFNMNPIVVALHKLWCDVGYEEAFNNLCNDHTKDINLRWHMLSLPTGQISCFACMHCLDELIGSPSPGWISTSSLLAWGLFLATVSEAPRSPRACALIVLVLSYTLSRLVVEHYLVWMALAALPESCFAYSNLPPVRRLFKGPEDAFLPYLVVRWILQAVLVYAPWSLPLHVGIALYVLPMLWATLVAESMAFHNKYTTLVGWILTLIVKEKVFFFHSCSSTNKIIQVIGHKVAQEEPTVCRIRGQHKATLAHSNYFPVTLLHKCLVFYRGYDDGRKQS